MTVPVRAGAPNDLRNLATRIKAAHAAVGSAMRHAIEAGQLLIEAKKQVPHGAWLSWLEQKCEMRERTAQAYMRIARQLEQLDDAKAQRVADLSFRDALKQFARTARTAKALSPSDLETVLTEAETGDTAVISQVAQQLINRQRFEKAKKREAHQRAADASLPAISYKPLPMPPHQVLLQRLTAIIDEYRAENPDVAVSELRETLNELYCCLEESGAALAARVGKVITVAATPVERTVPPELAPIAVDYPELPTFLDRNRSKLN
jgi:Protein of unknown function (DUF3102)